MGQATSLAAVALFLNTNSSLVDAEAGHIYHSEPERISNYRNSVAFIDAEVEALLSCQGSKRKFRYVFLFFFSFMTIYDKVALTSFDYV